MRETLEEAIKKVAGWSDLGECGEILQRLIDLFVIDPLLKIPNRLFFDLFLKRELSIAGRYGLPLGVLFIDVDGLKHVNDTYGHEAGDIYLHAVVSNLTSVLRSSDLVVRWGGDEFVVVVHANAEGLCVVKRRVTERLSRVKVRFGKDEVPLSVSIGCAEVAEGDLSGAIKLADKRMYEEKRRKRNESGGTFEVQRLHNSGRFQGGIPESERV